MSVTARSREATPTPQKGAKVRRGDLAGIDATTSDAIAVFCFVDQRPLKGVAGYLDWRLCGALSRAIESGRFRCEPGEVMLLPATGRIRDKRIFAFGLGRVQDATAEAFAKVGRTAIEVTGRAGVAELALAAPRSSRRPELEVEFVRAVESLSAARVGCVLVEEL